jgi:hypothetical protein
MRKGRARFSYDCCALKAVGGDLRCTFGVYRYIVLLRLHIFSILLANCQASLSNRLMRGMASLWKEFHDERFNTARILVCCGGAAAGNAMVSHHALFFGEEETTLFTVDGASGGIRDRTCVPLQSLIFPEPHEIVGSGSDFVVDNQVRIVVPFDASEEDLRLAGLLVNEVGDQPRAYSLLKLATPLFTWYTIPSNTGPELARTEFLWPRSLFRCFVTLLCRGIVNGRYRSCDDDTECVLECDPIQASGRNRHSVLTGVRISVRHQRTFSTYAIAKSPVILQHRRCSVT